MPGLKLRSPFTFPFFSGSVDVATAARSPQVPGRFHVAIDGRPFMLDTVNQAWGDQSIQRTRAQADDSRLPSERSLNPEGLWRRSTENWHQGAGQRFLDVDDDSSPHRFRSSKGIDPWTRGRISLLPTTDQKRTSSNTNLDLAPAGTRLYLLDGDELRFTTDVTVDSPTWTAVTADGTALDTPASITSDGQRVYAIDVFDIYYTHVSTTTYAPATVAAQGGSLIRYVKGRILIASGNTWTEMAGTPGALEELDQPILVHPNSDFEWVDFIGGVSQIYAAGFSGDKSLIYRTEIWQDGTGLTAPVVAGELPDGEIVRRLGHYLGFVLIGTDKGLRFVVPNQQGDLEIGQLLSTGQAVKCFEGQDRFVWFGWANYDETSTGLGRLDLSQFNELVPAYASDLMADTQGQVLDVVTFQDIRVFAVSAAGIYAETNDLVPVGSIDSGWFTYGITEPKTALFLDSQWASGAGQIQPSFAVDDGAFETVGATIVAANRAGSATAGLRQRRGRLFEVRYELLRDLNDTTQGPVLVRWTTRVQQASQPGVRHVLPLLLFERITTADGSEATMDPTTVRQALQDLHRTTAVAFVQEGLVAYQAVLDDWEWKPHRTVASPKFPNEGTFVAYLKELS